MTQRLIVRTPRTPRSARGSIETPAGEIDLDGEWAWMPVYPTLSEARRRGDHPGDADAAVLRAIADAHGVEFDPAWPAQKLVMELFGELVEPHLLQPTFVCDYPPIAQPLARQHRSDPDLIEAWDLIIGGVERGTGFSELIDPVIQRERLVAQSLKAAAGDPEAMQLDEDFLRRARVRRPADGRHGPGHRPADDAVHRRRHPRDDPVPAAQAPRLSSA